MPTLGTAAAGGAAIKYGPRVFKAIQEARGKAPAAAPKAAPPTAASKPGMISRAITSGRQLASRGVESGKAALQRVGPHVVKAIKAAPMKALGALGLLLHSPEAGAGSDFSNMTDEEIALYVEEMQRLQQQQAGTAQMGFQQAPPTQSQRPVRSEQVAQTLLQRRR